MAISGFSGDSSSSLNFLNEVKTFGQALVGFAGSVGWGGLRFDIVRDESVNRTANITTHYTEYGTPIQDDIIINPVSITLRGEVGEIVDRIQGENKIDKATRQITTCLSYVPVLTDTINFVSGALKNPVEQFDSISNVIDTGSNLIDLFNSVNLPVDKQSSVYLYFEALMNAKQTLTISTAWRKYPSMAIKSVQVRQTDTEDKSYIYITAQEIRQTVSSYLTLVKAGSSYSQGSQPQDRGWLTGIQESIDNVLSIF